MLSSAVSLFSCFQHSLLCKCPLSHPQHGPRKCLGVSACHELTLSEDEKLTQSKVFLFSNYCLKNSKWKATKFEKGF